MKIYRASLHDKELLIQLRLDFLKAEFNELSSKKETAIRKNLSDYLDQYLPTNHFVAMLLEIDGEVASAAFLLLDDRPSGPSFLTGVTAVLMNVWTYPSFRKRGLARQVVESLIDIAKEAGASVVDLFATPDGKALYEKLGFTVPIYLPMRLKL